jgi:hypothetical protein
VIGWNRDACVHMIRHQMPFHNLALLLLRQRVEDRSQLPAYLAENYFPSTFGNEDDMVPAVPLGVGLVVAEAVHVIFIELHLIGKRRSSPGRRSTSSRRPDRSPRRSFRSPWAGRMRNSSRAGDVAVNAGVSERRIHMLIHNIQIPRAWVASTKCFRAPDLRSAHSARSGKAGCNPNRNPPSRL